MSRARESASGARRGALVALGLAVATSAACSRFRVEFEDSGQRPDVSRDAPDVLVDVFDEAITDASDVADAPPTMDVVDASDAIDVPPIDVVDVVDVVDVIDVVSEEAATPPDAGPPPCATGVLPPTVPTGVRTFSLSETINPGAGGTGLVYGVAGGIFATGRSTPEEAVADTYRSPPSDVGAVRSNYLVGVDPGAPRVTWVQFFRNSVGEEGSGVAVGPASGEQLVFATGAFRGTLSVAGMSLTASPSRTEGYLARFTTNGALRSLVAIPGADGRDLFPVSMATGPDGTVCLVANERARDAATPPNDTASRVVLHCVPPTGSSVTYRYGRPTDLLYAQRVSVATDGEVVIGGIHRGDAMIGAQTLRTAPASTTLWLSRFDTRGELRWARSLMVTGYHFVRGLAAGCGGDVWVALDFESTVTFAGRTFVNNGFDSLIVRVAPDGTDRWAFALSNREADIVEAVVSDGAGNAVFSGSINAGEASFPEPTGGTIYGDPRDMFLVALSESGSPRWSRTYRTTRETAFSFDYITGLAVHGDTLAVMGQTFQQVAFAPSVVTPPGWFIAELR